MGYFTLDFKKAKGASDARMSDHIERRVIAPNVDSTRTHLNRELVELPEGVTVRDEAIAHRIKSAGIKRKITPDQVRAIRVMMSGTHEDMMKIQMGVWMNGATTVWNGCTRLSDGRTLFQQFCTWTKPHLTYTLPSYR